MIQEGFSVLVIGTCKKENRAAERVAAARQYS